MRRLLSHPFRMQVNGTLATVEQGSVDAYTEQIAVLMLTRPGERVLVPSFGIRDPAFQGVDQTELVNKLRVFGPPVRIESVTETPTGPMTSEVRVEFS